MEKLFNVENFPGPLRFHYRQVSLYFEVIDTILSEFDGRFACNEFLYAVASCFKMSSVTFLTYEFFKPFLDHYKGLLDESSLITGSPFPWRYTIGDGGTVDIVTNNKR